MKPLYTLLLNASVALGVATTAVQAQNAIEEWATAKFPAPPPLNPAKIVPALHLNRGLSTLTLGALFTHF